MYRTFVPYKGQRLCISRLYGAIQMFIIIIIIIIIGWEKFRNRKWWKDLFRRSSNTKPSCNKTELNRKSESEIAEIIIIKLIIIIIIIIMFLCPPAQSLWA